MRSIERPRMPGTAATDAAQSMLLGTPSRGPAAFNWRESFPEIIGRSAAMAKVLESVAKVARTDGVVLILGESGTGKELIAAALHRLSHRAPGRFVPINCGAIPEQLLESELFGYEKGAFTGADRKKLGKFAFAQGGSIFLDEIGDMHPSLQTKLLRVLQEKKFVPLGGNVLQEVDVRVIAATNSNLSQAIRDGRFREDLFYRLNVLPVMLPPLRERADDIPELLNYFVDLANRDYGGQEPCYLTDALVACLAAYSWPGNVRQLKNVVERLVVLKGGGALDLADLPPELVASTSGIEVVTGTGGSGQILPASTALPLRTTGYSTVQVPEGYGHLPEEGLDLPRYIADLENDLIRQALARTNNNRNQAAKLLGLNRTTLVERIKKRALTTLNEPSKEL